MASGRVPITLIILIKRVVLIFEGRKILIISLTRTGSIEYAAALANKLSKYNPLIISSEEAAHIFDYVDYQLETYSGKLSFIIKSLTIRRQIDKLLGPIKMKHDKLTIIFPVFHPWNNVIAQWAKKTNTKLVTVIHDFKMHLGEGSRTIEKLQNDLILLSDKIIFLTKSERDKALKVRCDLNEKTFVLPHPILKTNLKNNMAHSSQLKLLFVGRISKYKGIELLLDAAVDLEYDVLTIAGQGDLPKSKNLKSSKIDFINRRLDPQEIEKLLATHHVLILPYIDASQSGILTLGLDSNIPMIITDHEGLKEQLNSHTAIWCKTDSEGLKQGIEEYANNPQKYRDVKNRMREFKKEFDDRWEMKAKELFSL